MRHALLIATVACGSSSGPPAPAPPPMIASDARAEPDLAPFPYTAEQIRAASPSGRTIAFRRELRDKPTTIEVMEFVASDERGAEIASSERDRLGNPLGDTKRTRATWEELRQHAAFPRAATTIEDGTADTPAGTFPSKIYTVKAGDEVSRFYFAVARPGPPVLFYSEKAGVRTMTRTLLPRAPTPVACTTDDDCWLDDEYLPIPRPKALRGKKPKPCKDSEHVPTCREHACGVIAYKC